MIRHAFRATALLVLVLTAVFAVPSYAITKEVNQSYPLQPGGSFELQNVNGAIDVQGWDRNEVEIHAVKTAKLKESDLERWRSTLTQNRMPFPLRRAIPERRRGSRRGIHHSRPAQRAH